MRLRWDGDDLSLRGGLAADGTPPKMGGIPVFFDDIVVPASHTLPAAVMDEARHFDLSQLQPFDAAFLAGWPAEIYQVPAADASIAARQVAWARARKEARDSLKDDYWPGSLHLSSHSVSILSYKLILLPLWVARYRVGEEQYQLVANGQTGEVRGQEPPPSGWLSRLLDRLLG